MTPEAAEKHSIARVQRAISDIRKGKLVILTDDESRENEGDLVMAAEKVTPTAINFMAREGRGLICLSLTDEQVRQLHLPLMVTDNTSSFQTAFTVSIEAAHGVSTGISAADRAHTIKTAVAIDAKPVTDAGTLQFADGKVSGKAACNRFNATAKTEAGRLTLGPLATTRMMCPRMDVERLLLAALGTVARFEVQGARLRLSDASGQVRIELERSGG